IFFGVMPHPEDTAFDDTLRAWHETMPQDYRTNPGTDTMCPLSSLTAFAVSGATQSVLPAAFAADRTRDDTIYTVSGDGGGKSTMSPNVCFLTGTPLISPSSICCTDTRATLPDGGNVGPSVITIACGVRLITFIPHLSFHRLFPSLFLLLA